MLAVIRRGLLSSLVVLKYLLDYTVDVGNKIVESAGPNGYLIYGLTSCVITYFCSAVMRERKDIDWSINTMMRGISTWSITQILSITHNVDLTFPGAELRLITWRNSLIGCQQLFFFFVITAIPLKIMWIINNSAPVFLFILSFLLLGTRMSTRDAGFLFLSLLGVNLITAPQLLCSLIGFDIGAVPLMNGEEMLIAFIFFCSIGVWAVAIVIQKHSPTSTALSINNSLGFHLAIIGAIACIARQDVIVMPSPAVLAFDFFALGIPQFISQTLFIQGSIVAKNPGKHALTSYSLVVLAYVQQFIQELKPPSFLEIIGVIFMFYGVYRVVVSPADKEEEKRNRITVLSDLSLEESNDHHQQQQQQQKRKCSAKSNI